MYKDTITLVTILATILAILCLLHYTCQPPHAAETFNNSCNNNTDDDIDYSGPRYCAGCHAHLPPSAEKSCCDASGNCRCATTSNATSQLCECCKKNTPKPLSRLEREDLHLYGYLVSLLSSIGVKHHLHDI